MSLQNAFICQKLYSWLRKGKFGFACNIFDTFCTFTTRKCRSQWPCVLRRRSAASHLLRSWVRIPPWAWKFICCECFVLSGRGLCDGLITRQEESYPLWCVVVCDLETSRMRRPWPALGRSAIKKTVESMQWNSADNAGTVCRFNFCYKNIYVLLDLKIGHFDWHDLFDLKERYFCLTEVVHVLKHAKHSTHADMPFNKIQGMRIILFRHLTVNGLLTLNCVFVNMWLSAGIEWLQSNTAISFETIPCLIYTMNTKASATVTFVSPKVPHFIIMNTTNNMQLTYLLHGAESFLRS
jgi:hypothetical protein